MSLNWALSQNCGFSMLRELHAADVRTLLNGVAGMGAILAFVHFADERRIGSFWLGFCTARA